MAAGSLPNFEKFVVHSDEVTVGTRWKKWLARFNNLLTAMNATNNSRKKALLLHFAGEEVFDIYESFTAEQQGGADSFDRTVQSLNAYFSPKKNIDFETFKFRQCKQQEGETIESYNTRLRLLAANCDFQDPDREIKTQILQGCNSARLRRRALRENDMTLTKLIETARALEISDIQAKTIEEGSQSVNAVRHHHEERRYSTKSAPSHKSAQRGSSHHHQHRLNQQHQLSCGWCGTGQHSRDKCPAKDKVCSSCSKMGHFAKVCRSKDKRRRNHFSANVNAVHHTVQRDSDTSISSDEEYVFGVSMKSSVIPKVNVDLFGESVPFLIDTGASVNILDEQTFKQLTPTCTLQPTSTSIYAYGTHTPLNVLGVVDTIVKHKDVEAQATFFVIKSNPDARSGNLLSAQTAQKLNIINIAFAISQPTTADILCEENPELFQGIGKLKDVKVKLYIDEKVQPVAQPHRRIPYHMRKKVESEIQRLESLDIIEKVEGPTPWVSPIVAAPKPKKPDEIRICVDMRHPNIAIKRTRHIMPTVDDILVKLNQAKVFSKLDLNSGYHQLELDEDSRNITTFSTHIGLRRYKRLNFGVTSAAEIFQNHIAELLADIPNTLNTSDDILIYGKSQDEHDIALRKVFARFKEKELTLNRTKCEFNKDHIEFYGFIFGLDGVSPDPKKVEAIQQARTPENVKEVRSLLGLTNYVSRFIPQYADITKPLRDLTRKDAQWKWTETEENALRKLKSCLTSEATMKYFDPKRTTEVIVDASPYGLGAILTQRDKDNTSHVIAYASRALTDVESRYSQTEREALAVVYACEHFHLYLYGHPFIVISDHKPLEGIYNNPGSRTSARIERWNLRLQSYDFTLRYKPGKSNPADFLSRHPVHSADTQSTHEAKVAEEYIKFVISHTVPKAMTLEEIIEATKSDPTLQAVKSAIKCNQWHLPVDSSVDISAFQIFKTVKEELSVCNENGIILRKDRIVIPQALQQNTVDIAHEGHQGIVKTKNLLREKVWFPHMDRVVESKVKSCLACLSITPDHPSEPLHMSPLPSHPWFEVSLDFTGPFPSGEYLLVVIDSYSRFPEVEICHSTSASSIFPKLDAIFARHGIPQVVKTDNGPPFNSHEFKKFAQYLGFQHRKITPLWPQANGGVERCMPMLKKTIQAAKVENKPWRQELFKFLRNYRATPHSSTGVSPAEALYGRKIRVKLPENENRTNSKHDDNQEQLDHQIRQHDETMKAKMKRYADNKRHASDSNIQIGDTVLVRQKRSSKLTPFYAAKPLQVTAKNGSMLTAGQGESRITRNSSFFKKVAMPEKKKEEENKEEEKKEEENKEEEKKKHGDSSRVTTDLTRTTSATDANAAKSTTHHDDSVEIPSNSSNPKSTRRSSRRNRKPAYLKDYIMR